MSEKEIVALDIVKRHSLYAAAVGLVPVPGLNLAGVIGFELKMLKNLAEHYEIPFREDAGKHIVGSLIGGLSATELGYGALFTLKGIPLLGPILAIASLPFFAGALTWAVGKVFIQHFESGGTFLDFDPDKVRKYFADQFKRSKSTPVTA